MAKWKDFPDSEGTYMYVCDNRAEIMEVVKLTDGFFCKVYSFATSLQRDELTETLNKLTQSMAYKKP